MNLKKRFMKNLAVLLIMIFCIGIGQCAAKENKDLIKANYYYSHMAFHEAIPFYEKVAGQANDPVIYTQLADCYRLTGNLDKAAFYYDRVVKMPGCSPAVVLKYGQVLMELARYPDAEKWLKVYQRSAKGDRRAANLIDGCEMAQKPQNGIPSGIATLESFNTDGAEFAPTLWKDKLVFTSDTVIDLKKKTDNWTGHAYYNVYSIACDSKGNCTGDIATVADAKKLNIKYHNGPATFSADGTEMYYTRTKYNDNFLSHKSVIAKDSSVLLEVMVASGYNDTDKEFKTIGPFQYNSTDYTVADAAVSPDGKLLAFASNMPKGAGGSDIYICKKLSRNHWTKPVNAGAKINTEGEEVFPYWGDSNTLFFSSDGHAGYGGLDIYRATYDERSGTFSAPENVGLPLNSSYDDISLAMYADGRSTYFSSNRPAAKAGDNIYFYKKEKVILQLQVTDSVTGQPIANAAVSLASAKDKRNEQTDNNGKLLTQLYPEAQYSIGIDKDAYIPAQIAVNATGNNETDTLASVVKLFKIPAKDTIPPPPPVAVEMRHESVMDSPGVREFIKDKIYEVGHFYFDYNKYDLTGSYQGSNVSFLDTLATQLKRHPTMRIELRAHTDCRGTDAYNKVLSEKRALFVVNYLVKHGVLRKRLEYKGLGSSEPLARCPDNDCAKCTEEQFFKNRVLEFKVLHL